VKRLIATVCGLLGLLGLGGCERYLIEDIRPGVTHRSEVQEHMGPPGIEWRNDDGTVIWEYSMQPAGVTCYHLTIDAQGVIQQVEQVFTEARRAQIRPGMSQQQVRRLIGKPARQFAYPNKGEEVWDWLVDDRMPSESKFFNVFFDASGAVTRTGYESEQRG